MEMLGTLSNHCRPEFPVTGDAVLAKFLSSKADFFREKNRFENFKKNVSDISIRPAKN
jgi:chemotaxis methyl-accepting protein methylase